MLVDAHLHLWDPSRLQYDWLSHVPAIAHAHGHAEWAAQGVALTQAVFVQADCAPDQALAEVDWVTSLADQIPIGGIVAFAPLEKGEAAAPALEALRARPLVRGIRRSVQNEPTAMITDKAHIEGLALAASLGLSLDICPRAVQLPSVIQSLEGLYARVPGAVTVLDHMGKPDIARHGGDIRGDGWADNLRRLAAFPGLHCKLSGLTTQADWTRWRVEDLKPYIDHALDCFGPERCLYGGDWPVVDLSGGYQAWLDAFTAMTASLPASAQEAIRWRTAQRVYRLDI